MFVWNDIRYQCMEDETKAMRKIESLRYGVQQARTDIPANQQTLTTDTQCRKEDTANTNRAVVPGGRELLMNEARRAVRR